MIDLGDQVVDVLADILAALIRFADLRIQTAGVLFLLVKRSSQPDILGPELLVAIDQCRHGALQAFEIVVVTRVVGNWNPSVLRRS